MGHTQRCPCPRPWLVPLSSRLHYRSLHPLLTLSLKLPATLPATLLPPPAPLYQSPPPAPLRPQCQPQPQPQAAMALPQPQPRATIITTATILATAPAIPAVVASAPE